MRIRPCHQLGFTSGETIVEVPANVRRNDVVLLVPPPEMVATLSMRLRPFIPQNGHAGGARCDPDFINRRWRVYRYDAPPSRATEPASFFKPHYDAAQPRSDVRDGELIDDEPAKGVVRLSQLSVLLYLTEGHQGGDTVFYPHAAAAGSAHGAGVKVSPRKGAALCFWHGRHPLSPLHEGAPLEPTAVTADPKYVIRTDVLFATEPPVAESDTWESSSVVAAMLKASRTM